MRSYLVRTNEAKPARRRRKRATDPINHKQSRSDQAPGEEVVQVSDKYVGGGPPPSKYPLDDDQHRTGG